jgi:UDP-4-amino-4,6-dideoxy-N-acetyl-beta-L-altrosamine transaminase
VAAALPFLPYGRQCIDEDDIAAVAAVLRGDYLTTGPAVTAFEAALAERVGAKFAVSCNSGTAALHLAAMGLGLGPGDAVIVPSLTFVATANVARFVGAEVVFCDVDPTSGLITTDAVEEALSRVGALRPRAIFPVHLNGQPAPMAELAAYGLPLVEDGCHALGTIHDGAQVGAARHSQAVCFSFHPVKTVAMGEGGAVTCNDPVFAERLRRHRSHGIIRSEFSIAAQALDGHGNANPWYYEMPELGYNYRASDINCALALSQLGKLDYFVARRAALTALYDQALAPLAPLVRPLARVPDAAPGWHLHVVLIDYAAAGLERAELMERLRAQGIGSQVHYLPVHRQPYYRDRYGDLRLPGADAYYDSCLSLPLFPSMQDSDVARVTEALASSLKL